MDAVTSLSELFEQHSARLIFRQQPDSFPGDLRLAWRVTVLCMLIKKFRRKSAAAACLHPLWWAIRSAETRDLFMRWLRGEKSPDELLVRFDPSLDLSVDLVVGQGLAFVSDSGAILLTSHGEALVAGAWAEEDVLTEEKSFLDGLPTLTQKSIGELLEW